MKHCVWHIFIITSHQYQPFYWRLKKQSFYQSWSVSWKKLQFVNSHFFCCLCDINTHNIVACSIIMIGKKAAVSVAVVFIAICLRKFAIPGKKLAPIVSTTYGQLQGVISSSRDGREFASYYKIPFAKPPTGKLRFEVIVLFANQILKLF